jgi:CubicO group peptidase (beta-lactamase class C family)
VRISSALAAARRFVPGLVLGFALARPAPARDEPVPEVFGRVESAISAQMSSENIPGLSVAVVLDGRLVWSRGYGFADLENFVPFRPATVWRLGSVSKPLTAVAAMQLAEKGALDLDAPIQKFCPAFPVKPQPITTRLLLGHLSGIRHYAKGENFNSTRHYSGVVEALDAFKDDPLLQDPGTKFTYSTYGYVVLGCVVEGASRAKFADYVRENVTGPAGMTRTRPDDLYDIVPNRARGYSRQPDGSLHNADLADTSNKVPGGGFVSTAEDLGRFAIALFDHRILKPETFAAMQEPMKTSDGKESDYFGWTISDDGGDKLLTHSGSQQGTATYFLMVPRRRLAVAILTNTEDAGLRTLSKKILEILRP